MGAGIRLDSCNASRYSLFLIRAFKHAGLEQFFTAGSKRGIQPAHATKLSFQLLTLDAARKPFDMNLPGWNLHPLTGDLAGHWSIKVNANWRLTFLFEGEDATLVDYRDYH